MLGLLLALAAVAAAWLILALLRRRLEASFLADELQQSGEGVWRAVPARAGGLLTPRMVAGEVRGDAVEVVGSLLFLPFEHAHELAIVRQATPSRGSAGFVPAGVEALDASLAFRSTDPEWLRSFLSREDVRSALGPLVARAGDDPAFVAVRVGRGAGHPAYRKVVGSRSGIFCSRDPEAGPLGASDVQALVRILAPLKRALR
jgi:hypothetical protein